MRSDIVEVDYTVCAIGRIRIRQIFRIDQVGLTLSGSAVFAPVGPGGPDKKIRQPVPIHIPGRGHRIAGFIAHSVRINASDELVRGWPGSDIVEVDYTVRAIGRIRRRQIRRIDQVGLTRIITAPVGVASPDKKIREPVPIHIPGRGHRKASAIACRATDESVRGCQASDVAEIDLTVGCAIGRVRRRQIRRGDQVSLALYSGPDEPDVVGGPDEKIRQPIPIHIPGRGHRNADLITGIGTNKRVGTNANQIGVLICSATDAANDTIVAHACHDGVIVLDAFDGIVAGAAVYRITAPAPNNAVVATAAFDGIVVTTAID